MITVVHCPGEHVDKVWDDVGPILERALERGHRPYTLDDLLDLVRKGQRLLLVATDDDRIIGAATAMMVRFPHKMELHVGYLAGERGAEWKAPMSAALEAVCRYYGASAIEFRGRNGWGRVLEGDGYVAFATVYRKELTQ